MVGLITPDDVKHVEKDRWEQTTVLQAMSPIRSLHPVKPDVSAGEALELMGRAQIRRLPVVEDGRLVGMVAMADFALESDHAEEVEETLEEISQPVR